MKKLLYFLIFFSQLSIGFSTPELSSWFYKKQNIEIEVVFRYKNQLKGMYYEALSVNLNNYVKYLKEKGELQRGKVYLEIMDAIWMDHATGIQMYRFKTGYYCFINALTQKIDENYLMKVIKYFTRDDWESFCYDYDKISPAKAQKIFNHRLDDIEIDFKPEKLIIKRLNSVSFIYENGEMFCDAGEKKYNNISALEPFSINNRDLFVSNDIFYVIENGKIICEFENYSSTTNAYYQEYFDIYEGWVNISEEGKYILSYSYKENKFYNLSKQTSFQKN
jgi:hypothetical protein